MARHHNMSRFTCASNWRLSTGALNILCLCKTVTWWSYIENLQPGFEKKGRGQGCFIFHNQKMALWHQNLEKGEQHWRMANTVDPVLSHHTSQERWPAAVSDLPNNQPRHQSPKQSHAEDHTEQTEAISGEDHRWRTLIIELSIPRSHVFYQHVRCKPG